MRFSIPRILLTKTPVYGKMIDGRLVLGTKEEIEALTTIRKHTMDYFEQKRNRLKEQKLNNEKVLRAYQLGKVKEEPKVIDFFKEIPRPKLAQVLDFNEYKTKKMFRP